MELMRASAAQNIAGPGPPGRLSLTVTDRMAAAGELFARPRGAGQRPLQAWMLRLRAGGPARTVSAAAGWDYWNFWEVGRE